MLSKAIKNNDYKIVKKILNEKKINPAGYRNSALTNASYNGYTKIVKLLLEDSRVDQTAYDFYCINRACEHKYYGIIKLLIQDTKVDFSSVCGNLLFNAIYSKNIKLSLLLCTNKYFFEALKKFHPKEYNLLMIKKMKKKVSSF
jgi:hypothetical protein